jgi:competence protein ComEC
MTKSKIFFYFCLAFIVGIFLSSTAVVSQPLGLIFLILGIILISLFWKRPDPKEDKTAKKIVVIGFCLIFFFLGAWRCQSVEWRIENNQLRKYNDSEKNIVLKGIIVQEPDLRRKSQRLIFQPEKIQGRILLVVNRYPEYRYGDELKIKGELKTPPQFQNFNYKNYLAEKKIYSLAYWPKVELLERNKGNVFYSFIWQFKSRLRESVYQSLSPPQSLILAAMLLGDKNKMPEYLKEKLNTAGVRHITAVSGLHIVILSGVLMSLLLALGLWRGQAFYLSIIFISFFIIMTGAQPSGIRAGIMGGLYLLGQKMGRKSISFRTIVITAALMLAFNPLLLNDIGFQLSFLAITGIASLAPIFREWLRVVFRFFLKSQKSVFLFLKQHRKWLAVLEEIAAVTFAAQVFTFPLLLYRFGRLSLAAPLTNILIVPVVYWIMVFGFIFSLIGIILPAFGLILSFPCLFLLIYLTKITDFFSKPWAVESFGNIHWFWLFISYLILGGWAWRLNKKVRLKFLD